MPTGYIAGILDGEIKTFEQFAKLCIRAFGATVHMRDDGMDTKYVPMEPSNYHTQHIENASKLLSDAKTLSDAELIAMKQPELIRDKAYHEGRIANDASNIKKMNEFVKKAEEYKAPTMEHQGIKDFMIQQLTSTIKFDFSDYHEKKLIEIIAQLKNISAETIRDEMVISANKELAYHKKEHAADVKRCVDSNKWVDQFLSSLK